MRICHVIATSDEWGGLQRAVAELAAIQAQRHHVMVLAARDFTTRLDPTVASFALPMHDSRRNPRLLWSLWRASRRFAPDIIHAHANKAAALIATLRPLLGASGRVATVHNTKRSTRVFASFDQVIAVSRQAGAALGRPHTVIWNAVPGAAHAPAAPIASDVPFLQLGKPLLLAVGRLVRAKGFDLLLDALREVDACLWLVGDGPLRGALERQAATLGLEQRVWFAGYRKDVPRLMATADMLVISSRNEGFPFVLVEALSRHCPVISTRIGGADEILPARWLCPPGAVTPLGQMIGQAIAQRSNLRAEFHPVFELAARELVLETAQQRIEDVYRKALERRAR